MNCGAAAGQSVFHIHPHKISCCHGDRANLRVLAVCLMESLGPTSSWPRPTLNASQWGQDQTARVYCGFIRPPSPKKNIDMIWLKRFIYQIIK